MDILILDDEPEICDVLQMYLEDDYDVCCETNPTAALEIIKNSIPKFAIIDLGLGDISGIDIISDIRTFNSEIKIVVSTGYSRGDINVTAAFEAGANDMVQKPFDQECVLDVLQKVS